MEKNNMIRCKACGGEIAKGVKKCIHCGKDQRNFFMRHKILTGILVIIIIAAIGAMGGNDKPSSGGTKDVSKTTEQQEEKTEFTVGEIISYKDFDLIFENQRELTSMTGDETYLVLDVTITSKKDDFNFFGDIQGVTDDNEVVDNTIPFVEENIGDMIATAWTKTLNDGQVAKGYVAFDKSIDKIEVRSSFFTNDVITIKLD